MSYKQPITIHFYDVQEQRLRYRLNTAISRIAVNSILVFCAIMFGIPLAVVGILTLSLAVLTCYGIAALVRYLKEA